MLYLIDGHNLIPKLPGMSLAMLDDEPELIKLLQVFARVKRARVEVYFDGAKPGYSGTRHMGTVTAHYIRLGIPADREMISRLQKSKKNPQGIILVTSDRQIRAEAAASRIKMMLSDEFADLLISSLMEDETQGGPSNQVNGATDLDEWLKLFGGDK